MSVRLLASQVGVCTIDLETVQESLAILLLTITQIKIPILWHVIRQTGSNVPSKYFYVISYCSVSEVYQCSPEMLLCN
jgi:hypothetical protein